MKTYFIAGQEISITDQLPRLERYQFTGAEIISTPAPLSVAEKLISRATGWVAGEERIVEIWSAGEGVVLHVPGFRDFYIAPRGKAILPVGGDSELTDLEQDVVLGPALALALALGGKWCLHASATSFDNKGMVFLGESGYGKSTLAAYLAEAGKPGWQHIADDILPVSLGEGGLTGWTHFPQLKLPAEKQPSIHLPETMLIDHIYLLDPDDSALSPQLKQLSTDEMVRVLLGNTAGSRLYTPELLTGHLAFCAQAARHVTGYRLSYAHQRELLPVVKELLEQNLKQDKYQDMRKKIMKISPNSKIVQTENTLLQELDREAVLLNLENNQYYRLDENSLLMFKLMISSVDLSEAQKVLSAEYDVPAEKLWCDLIVFAEDLEKSGLVRVLNE